MSKTVFQNQKFLSSQLTCDSVTGASHSTHGFDRANHPARANSCNSEGLCVWIGFTRFYLGQLPTNRSASCFQSIQGAIVLTYTSEGPTSPNPGECVAGVSLYFLRGT